MGFFAEAYCQCRHIVAVSRQALLLTVLVASFVGGGLGSWVGSSVAVPASQGGPSFEPSLESVSTQVQSLSRSFEELAAEFRARAGREHVASASVAGGPPERQVAENASGLEGLNRALDRLTELTQSLAASVPAVSVESIRVARLQNPDLHLDAIRQLQENLNVDDQATRQATKRAWLLCGMDEIIRRLGCPSNILRVPSDPMSQSWEYIVPNGSTLVLRFASGLVVAVED